MFLFGDYEGSRIRQGLFRSGVVARFLDSWGYDVKVAWLADPARLRGDAATQWVILDRSAIDQAAWHDDDPSTIAERLASFLSEADWVVDALLGTGLTRAVEGPLRAAIEAINACAKPVLALDLPSGLCADQGRPLGVAVRATLTATFVALKVGFLAPESKEFTGEIRVVDIGLPRKVLELMTDDHII